MSKIDRMLWPIDMQNKDDKPSLQKFVLPMVIIFAFLVSFPLASALGTSPAFSTVEFKPNANVELSFDIINSEKGSFNISLSSQGELKDLVFFESSTVSVLQDAYRTPFKAIIRFPEELSPGEHQLSIKITPEAEPGSTTFSAFVSPEIPIKIRVPYPSKYAVASLLVLETDEGTPVPIYAQFDNMGNTDISRAGAELQVFDPSGKLVENRTAPDIAIAKNYIATTEALPRRTLMRGDYSSVMKAHYDEFTQDIVTNFSIGVPVMRIRNMASNKLFAGEINKVSFNIFNDWNRELEVGGYIELPGKKSEVAASRVVPREEHQLDAFIDTSGLAAGEYNLTLTLAYSSQITSRTFPVQIIEKPLLALPSRQGAIQVLVIGLIVLLIIVAIAFLIYIKRKKKGEEQSLSQDNELP